METRADVKENKWVVKCPFLGKFADIVEKTKEPKVKSREGQATGINNKST